MALASVGIAAMGRAEALTVNNAVCAVQSDNALRFDCTIETDSAADVNLEFCDSTVHGSACTKSRSSETVSGSYTGSCTGSSPCWQYDLTVWNMISGHSYEWRVKADDGVATAYLTPATPYYNLVPGSLPSPDLADIDIGVTVSGTYEVEYLMLNYACQETEDAGTKLDYAIVLDDDGNIVWYQDPREQTSRSSSFVRGFTVTRPANTLLLIDSHDTILEYNLAGDVLAHLDRASGDFEDSDEVDRYVHHDIKREGTNTFVLTAKSETIDGACGTDYPYVIDGVFKFDSSWDLVDEWDIDEVYTPSGCCSGGYWGTVLAGCDWTHANSFWTDSSGDWLLSLKHLSRIIQVDGSAGTLDWALHGDNVTSGEGDFDIDTGASVSIDHFNRQHHAWWTTSGTLMLFDNHNDDTHDSRGIEIAIDHPTAGEFAIINDWDMALNCTATGSTMELLPSGNVVVTCGPTDKDRIIEFDGSTEVWKVELDCPVAADLDHNTALYRGRPMKMGN